MSKRLFVFQCPFKCFLYETFLFVIRFSNIEPKFKRKIYQQFFIWAECMSDSSISGRWSLNNIPMIKFNLSEAYRLQFY